METDLISVPEAIRDGLGDVEHLYGNRSDRLGKARVVELNAEIIARLVAIGLRLPRGARLGSAGVDPEAGRALPAVAPI